MASIKHLHVLRQVGASDALLAFATRDGGLTDALYQWVPSTGWSLIKELPGTGLIYDSVTWRNRLYWVDGKNSLGIYDGTGFCASPPQAPVGQFIVVYQGRLVIGGDARLVPSEVSAVNSNRNLIRYCESLDDSTWSPNNFVQCDIVGDGQVISGLAVNTVSTSDQGAQANLLIFHPTATLMHKGVLGSGDVELDVLSGVRGCPGYHTITDTPYGVMFASSQATMGSKPTVCVVNPQGGEPMEIGFPIWTDLVPIQSSMHALAAAVYHDNMLKVAFNGTGTGTANDHEWWLDLRQTVFPGEHNWYGAHLGDSICQWVIYQGKLVAAQNDSMNVWEVDVEGQWGSMATPATARTSTQIWPRIRVQGQKKGQIDAYGMMGQIAAGVVLTGSISIDRGTQTISDTWTAPASLSSETPMYALIRPARFEGHDAKITWTHSAASDITVDSIYVRSLQRGRQQEKQSNSSQT